MTEQPPGPEQRDAQLAAIAAARAELAVVLATAREATERRRAQPVHTPEERAELHRDARAGVLGADMQRLAQHVEAGEESWQEVFEGTAPHQALFEPHLQRMAETHAEEIRVAIEEDEDFDPWAPDPEVG